ncbi:hypothetical protein JYU34_018094 [Plutella xylostella]|uniref:C2H2-type domain-containing protein n=1 Tax=Plutella xylostella TaxID=51655 RepID=A0ABQ7PZZ7_PLUXY|nr:hypothetical protein JYU34_018094 [Plutella xylostella]
MCNSKHGTLIKKITGNFESDDDDDECKFDIIAEEKTSEEILEDKVNFDDENQLDENIKKETQDTNKTSNENDPVQEIILRNEKKITVARKRKKSETLVKKIEPSYKVTEDLKCRVCSEVLPNVRVFHTHMNRHFPNHICETCGKGFLTEKRLKRHAPSHDKGPFECADCGAIFTNYNTCNSHRQRKHASVGLYKCPRCGERFRTFTRRARHLAAAHGTSTKYQCQLCPQSFLVSGNLSSHVRNTHRKERRHACARCPAAFFHKHELRAHGASHSGECDHHCDICGKSYPRKNALEVHKRTHTGDKPYGCDACGRRFTQKCTLTKHIKTHIREPEAREKSSEEEMLPTLVVGADTLSFVLA